MWCPAQVSDGVIAPDFDDDALAILKTKKGGKFIILKADVNYKPPELEYREVFGVGMVQKRNDAVVSKDTLQNVVSQKKDLPEEVHTMAAG